MSTIPAVPFFICGQFYPVTGGLCHGQQNYLLPFYTFFALIIPSAPNIKLLLLPLLLSPSCPGELNSIEKGILLFRPQTFLYLLVLRVWMIISQIWPVSSPVSMTMYRFLRITCTSIILRNRSAEFF